MTPKRELWSPQASENCAPKESNRTNTIGVHSRSKPFCLVLFLVFTPKCEGKIQTKKGFCAPKRERVPKQKPCPKRKQQDRCHRGAFSRKTFVLFFGLSPNVRAKSASKEVFCAPKVKIMPDKATGPTPRRCNCDKDLFFGLYPRIYFFCTTKIFYAPLFPSTLLWRRVYIQ